jgi:dTDP-4-amino-4,6-dideoxygalactose transaminase
VKKPAILGGAPAFSVPLPFARPATPPLDAVMRRVAPSFDAGRLTNGPLVAQLEEEVAERQGVAHAIAVSNCTAGLMLALQAVRADGPVIVPSFTFSASVAAIVWNGRAPVFAECDPDSFQLDAADARRRADGAGAVAVLATHVFGAPCAVDALEELGRELDLPVIYDAAHAQGARHGPLPMGGFGTAEVFSLSPTKPVVSGEGGLVLTNDAAVADHVRVGRDYGNPGDYDTRFVGLSARMSELHAATALESLVDLDDRLQRRHEQVAVYRKVLKQVPGVRFQRVADTDFSTYKDLTIAIGADFGMSRDRLVRALDAEGVETRCYFSPPVHRQTAYRQLASDPLPTTDAVAGSVVSLPVFPQLSDAELVALGEAVAHIQTHAEEIAALDAEPA